MITQFLYQIENQNFHLAISYSIWHFSRVRLKRQSNAIYLSTKFLKIILKRQTSVNFYVMKLIILRFQKWNVWFEKAGRMWWHCSLTPPKQPHWELIFLTPHVYLPHGSLFPVGLRASPSTGLMVLLFSKCFTPLQNLIPNTKYVCQPDFPWWNILPKCLFYSWIFSNVTNNRKILNLTLLSSNLVI